MPTHQTIDDFRAQKRVAFVGASRESKQFATSVYRQLPDGGRILYPVNRSQEPPSREMSLSAD